MTTDTSDQDGFSLVELLVVVVILGILAAIAIPAFLSQRQSAYDGAAVSDLRNLIATQTGVLTSNGAFTEDAAQLASENWVASEGIVACADTSAGGQEVTLAAWHVSGGSVYSWSSATSLTSVAAVPPPADCGQAIAPGASEVS